MRNMNEAERKQIEWLVQWTMAKATSEDYARYILTYISDETEKSFMDDVIQDVMETSAWDEDGYYNEDDVRLAIGRVFMERLGFRRWI